MIKVKWARHHYLHLFFIWIYVLVIRSFSHFAFWCQIKFAAFISTKGIYYGYFNPGELRIEGKNVDKWRLIKDEVIYTGKWGRELGRLNVKEFDQKNKVE